MTYRTVERLYHLNWPPREGHIAIWDPGCDPEIFSRQAQVVLDGQDFNLWDLIDFAYTYAVWTEEGSPAGRPRLRAARRSRPSWTAG